MLRLKNNKNYYNMNVKEEIQLAIDINIESALEFVLLAKLNANGRDDGYWGYFNNRRVWLSCVPFKIGDNLISHYPKNYYTDNICRINYDLKVNQDRIQHLQKMLGKYLGHDYIFIRDALTEAYEYEAKLIKQKNFFKRGDKSKSIVLADYKNYPLVEVINNSGFELLRAGNNKFKMCCPFHKEKTPSFFVDADKNRFNCFGCGEHGDTLDFISKYEKISVIEAAKKLLIINE